MGQFSARISLMKSITTDRVIVSRLVAKVVRVALSVACMAIITCQGISALKAPISTGSRGLASVATR